ncbi:copper homeostasis membrane protein CopD [Sphingomonas sp. BT-65]|uniref:copper homeostasis membrane protein CopD n=1 Tax=Sphingomonas sp. BT-65 TaxID=2989821 RepID=UPI0022357A7B|nr:copper homeostasis membrane protein CopD [Sphingomonas sp. BT-65]MCW4463559.1 copper homeostasis membrane protein CopD [Sphingomonas sp. BT-65]
MDAVAVALRFGLYLDLTALFGIAAFGLYGLRGDERRSGAAIAFRPLLGGTALLGLLLSAAGLAVLAAAMAGVPLTAVDSASIAMIVEETAVGTAWIVRMAALALVLASVLVCGRRPVLMLSSAGLGGAIALASLAWGGHAAMREGATGAVHLGADILHLLAAGIWIGALAALLLLLFRRSDRMTADHLRLSHRALDGFATIGTIVVATLVVTGTVNLLLVVGLGQLAGLLGSLYGQLLLLKLLAFAVMLGLAASHRFRLVPAFERALAADDHPAALGVLRKSLIVETLCAVLILALVAWFGMLEPVPA